MIENDMDFAYSDRIQRSVLDFSDIALLFLQQTPIFGSLCEHGILFERNGCQIIVLTAQDRAE